jgi:palmitoyltransferase
MEINTQTPLITKKVIETEKENKSQQSIPKKNIPIFHYLILIIFYFIFFTIIYGITKIYIFNKDQKSFFKIPISIIFYFSSLMIFICHYKSITTNNSINYSNINNNILNNHCNKCKIDRPQRAHHCRICGICNLKMDHHCPWILNCVGEKNEKFFFLFLIYSIIGCLISCILTFDYFLNNFNQSRNFFNQNHIHITFLQILFRNFNNSLPVITFCFSFVFGLSVFIILYINFIHIKIGLTTIEMEIYGKNFYDCPYYNNNWKENLIKLFGNEPLKMFLPFEKSINQIDLLENDYIALK